ncbi:MAG: ABC transporter ATP-binding protein [Gemmatimonadota bacterium]|nr:ABC transporter ATP-binding protein [Gemmatimonadota bacterium]MDE3014547.1 ABC transporter ATP-binding protein [Gemmatimonadota bacterium]
MEERAQPGAEGATPSLREVVGYGRRAFGLVWSSSRSLTLVIASLTLAVALLPTAAAWVGKLIVDGVLAAIASGLEPDRDQALLWVLLEAIIFGALIVSRRMLQFQKRLLHAELGFSVSQLIHSKALKLELQQIETPRIQEMVLLAKQRATSKPFALVNRIFEVSQYSVTLLSFAALLVTFSPWAVVVVLIGGLPLFFGELRYSGVMFRFYTGKTPELRERSYLESLMTSDSGAPERIHFDSGPAIMELYETLFSRVYRQDRSLQRRGAAAGASLSVASSGVFFATKIWIVWETIAGVITLGQMTMFITLVKQGQAAVTSLLASVGGMYNDLLYASNLYAYLDLPEISRGGNAREGPHPDDGLRLENVSYTYPGSLRPAVDGVSLHLPPGYHLGLIGVNGSGKTTMVKLMTGLYRPDAGRVLLDGLDLEEWDREALRSRMGVLFQPFVRYKSTVADNISFGSGLRITDEELLLAAADRGLARALVDSLPGGLGTRLTRRFLDGQELSGGQWQRLALARALLREDANILILDEPTSALDAVAEAELFDSFTFNDHDRTLVLISHRLANIRNADAVVVMQDGRIVEFGAHGDLMEKQGIYRDLFSLQAAPYNKE